ncbi:MAG: flagellar motor switch protein FliG [Ignavibacteria bacterium GWB2_35_12]|nr:MAG: flagellar motor switch protein FliG [Ignavibacteria bacterium GWA2_35_8]OGU41226.1 MAG: flagellar motor switch protein FliG [Ignavibacteria bacterium GWB2_35_12]OGU86768.1 MAG: flagellar motor switch protein FliG [Ignavibacteria bacterium RIFOXYA2_FULL_35_10]OGV23149.1 MAG: flagellar motor switch protein FliG [Ignavibacteria bacterium RIFOXYC2_FULL_35_21]
MKKKTVTTSELTGRQKAAILLMSLDVEVAAKVFKELDMHEVEQIAVEITNLKDLSSTIIEEVIEEFYQLMTAQSYMVEGGIDFAQVLLEKSYGMDRAKDIIEKIRVLTTVRGFNILKKADPQQLASFLSKEHPQTIALILSHLSPDQSADVLNEFKEDLRIDSIHRIAKLGKVSPTLLSQIEHVVDEIAETTLSQDMAIAGGAQLVANILNRSTNASAKAMLESIETRDFDMATQIKRLMFLFEDIVTIDDRGIQRILRDVDKRDLALALKISDDKIKQKIFKNMSERASEVVKEELEFMGPVKLKEVEAAQIRIVDIIKQLEDQDEISIGGKGKEDVFV